MQKRKLGCLQQWKRRKWMTYSYSEQVSAQPAENKVRTAPAPPSQEIFVHDLFFSHVFYSVTPISISSCCTNTRTEDVRQQLNKLNWALQFLLYHYQLSKERPTKRISCRAKIHRSSQWFQMTQLDSVCSSWGLSLMAQLCRKLGPTHPQTKASQTTHGFGKQESWRLHPCWTFFLFCSGFFSFA